MHNAQRAVLGITGALAFVVAGCGTGPGKGAAAAPASVAPAPANPIAAAPAPVAPAPGAPAPQAVAIPTCGPVSVPPFNAANFPQPTKIDSRWFPLVPGTQFVLDGHTNRGSAQVTHQIVSTVTDLTKVINGVTTMVIWEVERNQGTLTESRLVFYAQDRDGNVWSFGQHRELYTNGKFTGAPKTWFAGLSRADAGVHVRAEPHLEAGEYLQGVAPTADVLGCAKDVKLNERTCVAATCYDGVAVVDERGGENPGSGTQRMFYAPGIGAVRVETVGDPKGETLVLAKVIALEPAALAAARQSALDLEKHAYQINANGVYRQTTLATQPRQ